MSETKVENEGKKESQFGDLNNTGEDMDRDKWQKVWESGMTRFHLKYVHPMLERFYDTLVAGRSGSLRIFLPMSGKSKDINWLAEKGHCVIGVEFAEFACRQFFNDHEIAFTEEIMNKGCTVFKSSDGAKNVTLYCCDFYSIDKSITGELDAVWDRGALAAINPGDRKKYVETMCRVLSPSTVYLVDTFLVDNTVFAGPPHNFPIDELKSLFASHATVEHLAERDGMTDWQRSWGVDYFYENVSSVKFQG
ncbi:hypothetical protein CAPTEDRAFT_184405, partial [Capitella teleta]